MARIFEKAVFVIGSTAVGKTKLGIEIAKQINGEIISTDSMQIYQKASLMTAKPTLEEQLQVKHHLIDFLPLNKSNFTVREYQELALNAASDIISRGKTPVFVGGTMYYVESVLFDKDYPHENLFPEISDSDILKNLELVDENLVKISDSNPRHLRNAYFYFLTTGKKPSERILEQKLRFKHNVVIWLQCSLEVLELRVKKRIEAMIQEGGLSEIEEILNNCNCDLTRGVLQSIGYKEFEPYFLQKNTLQECIDRLVLSTMQYSKKQIRWIKNRIHGHLQINRIDTSNAEDWESIKRQGLEALEKETGETNFIIPKQSAWNCETCGITLKGNSEWTQHIRSKKHKKKKELQVSDDDIERPCEICEKPIQGKKNWVFHLKSKKHIRKSKNQQVPD